MTNYKITCERCSCEIDHVCNPSLRTEAKKLFEFVPNARLAQDVRLDPADKTPFFTKEFLTALVGEDDGRFILKQITRLIHAAGLNPWAIEDDVVKARQAKDKTEKALRDQRESLAELRRHPATMNKTPDGDRWDYLDAIGWDEAIEFNCEYEDHDVMGIEDPKWYVAHCKDCNKYYRLPKEAFREVFVVEKRTPVSKVAFKFARSLGAQPPGSSPPRRRRRR